MARHRAWRPAPHVRRSWGRPGPTGWASRPGRRSGTAAGPRSSASGRRGSVARPPGHVGALGGGPRAVTFHRRGVADPDVVEPAAAVGGQLPDHLLDQRQDGAQRLVVARLVRQVREVAAQVADSEAEPPMFAVEARQRLGDRQADRLGLAQPDRVAGRRSFTSMSSIFTYSAVSRVSKAASTRATGLGVCPAGSGWMCCCGRSLSPRLPPAAVVSVARGSMTGRLVVIRGESAVETQLALVDVRRSYRRWGRLRW